MESLKLKEYLEHSLTKFKQELLLRPIGTERLGLDEDTVIRIIYQQGFIDAGDVWIQTFGHDLIEKGLKHG